VCGLDSSADALALAAQNGAALGLDVSWRLADLLSGAGRFDAVLANLPYVEDGCVLAPEIARYEPDAALYAGPDGLAVIRRVVGMLNDDVRVVALEVGAGQAVAVAGLLSDAGFARVERLEDLARHERVVTGSR
jgi:release factor glutamine methyltransferase